MSRQSLRKALMMTPAELEASIGLGSLAGADTQRSSLLSRKAEAAAT
jgi:hypothetical protein